MDKAAPVPRLDDVAALAGVAKSTVSRVMSGEATLAVRGETRQRILDAAEQLGYRPDVRARALRLKRSHMIGIVVPEIDNPAFGTIIRSAQKAAIERGYSLFISLADKDQPDTELYRRLIEGNRVDGILLTTVSDPSLVAGLRRQSIRYVLVNRELDERNDSIIVDYETGTAQAVEHLTALGHRSLCHVSGPLHQYAGRKRLDGFRAGLAAAGLPFEASMVGECNYGWAEAGAAFERIVAAAGTRPTAVCAANTIVAAGIIAAARQMGLSVPRDLSVIALLDGPLATMQVPAITAVQYPFESLGQRATHRLIDSIEFDLQQERERLEPLGIVVRASTAAPPA
ncbi:LacI family DNA-binding transcriptional regulator [Bosea sp. (in: a-proteobacteria)]|jgi:DNA-binding LacI/PurR family transcriptional regulator|uniref:LacI family DNA-binding transcriptional regulator n=1 Tax=Bosea sp. (in: a-proteobacteria) TaxID=1871050 RepID=UPI003F6EE6E6